MSIGVNGFGRIGKCVFLQLIYSADLHVAAINAPDFNINKLEVYLKHDSVHRYNKTFNIKNNASLASIELSSITSIENTWSVYTTISDNPSLSLCNETYVCEFIELHPQETIVTNNAVGCKSFQDVVEACGIALIQGNVYYDENCNSNFDPEDFGISNKPNNFGQSSTSPTLSKSACEKV